MNATLALSAALLGLAHTAALAAPTPPPAFTPHWTKMPIVSADARKAGIAGGEGSQWPRGPVAVSPADPNFLLLPIDVGGLYRSLDGGAHWEVSMVGWDARGANGFAIDPRDASHVLGIAGNSMNWDPHWGPSPHGLYLSMDKAASWTHVLALTGGIKGAVAFDPSSYAPARGYCTRAYHLANGQGVYRTDDGGRTWVAVHAALASTPGRSFDAGGGFASNLEVASDGTVYAGGVGGLFRSRDRGRTFETLRTEEVDGLALTPGGGTLYVSGSDGVLASRDGGTTFAALPGKGLERPAGLPVVGVAVSPADPRRMLCWIAKPNFQWPRYVSQDGGASWQAVTLDNTGESLPYNARQNYATWSPSDPDVAYSIGGDWATKSTDGGKTFHWSNNGYNGIMVGGTFGFSPHAPGVVFLGFQDYNGAFTTDGGRTWSYRDVSGLGWGGQEYGALALSRQVMWAGDSGSSWSPPRHMRLSRDGGATWAFVPGPDGKPLTWAGPDVSYADPANAQIAFASNLRTGDGGATWQPMPGCDGVFTSGPVAKALYGKKGDAVVRSQDHGVTWAKITDVEGGFMDLAVGAVGRIYVASQDRLKVWDGAQWTTLDTPKDQFGSSRVWTVATDPQVPSVVYVGGPRNTYASQATVCRSTDGGRTWRNLTVTTPLSPKSSAGPGSGPHEVSCIRVNPVTREAWVNGQCYGMWRIAPPTPGEKGVSATLASAPPAVNPPAATATLAAGR